LEETMKELDFAVFLAVFQEMLGWGFWPLVAFIVLGAVALVVVVAGDRGIESRRFVRAELVGLVGGFVGIWFALAITGSRLADIGGPIDWVLMIAIWVAGAVGATIVAYVAMGLVARYRRRSAATVPAIPVSRPAEA
jgi:hypothetical protein